MSIFDHTDDDGDRIMISKSETGNWIVGIVPPMGPSRMVQVILGPAQIEQLAREAFRMSDWGPARILPTVDAEISWPDDGRRVAALQAAAEVLQPGSRTSRDLIRVADWILNPRTEQ